MHVSKSTLTKLVKAGHAHESFTHSESGEFDVTLMRAHARASGVPMTRVDIDQLLPFLADARVWEEHRVQTLTEDEWLRDPMLAVEITQGNSIEHLFIDGIHRLIRRQREGLKYALVLILPESDIIRPDQTKMMDVERLGVTWGRPLADLVAEQKDKPE